jgi:uncharacterized protein GlcG (DUF336 family)
MFNKKYNKYIFFHFRIKNWRTKLDNILTSMMNLEMACTAIKAAIGESEKLKLKMNIAVVDVGGNLVSFVRMDGAWLGSMDISIKKAKTSTFFGMPSSELGKLSQPGGPLYCIEHSNGGLITFPGGIPIHNENEVLIGGIGVSGSSVENDFQVADAGRKAITG